LGFGGFGFQIQNDFLIVFDEGVIRAESFIGKVVDNFICDAVAFCEGGGFHEFVAVIRKPILWGEFLSFLQEGLEGGKVSFGIFPRPFDEPAIFYKLIDILFAINWFNQLCIAHKKSFRKFPNQKIEAAQSKFNH